MKDLHITKKIEKLYDCKCDIYEYEETTDETTGITSFNTVLKHSGVKCRVSYSTGLFQGSGKITSSDDNGISQQYVKILMSKDITFKPGSVFEVTKEGNIYRFKNSGKSFVFKHHQEILVQSENEYN